MSPYTCRLDVSCLVIWLQDLNVGTRLTLLQTIGNHQVKILIIYIYIYKSPFSSALDEHTYTSSGAGEVELQRRESSHKLMMFSLQGFHRGVKVTVAMPP